MAMEPPIVPLCRTAGSPICAARSQSAGQTAATVSLAATSACVVPAPMVTFLPETLIPFISAMGPRSIRSEGAESRVFMAGMRVMPPERYLASSPFLARLAASAGWPRRIVIVSDLVQHSEALSFYRGDDWESFRASPDFARLARNLDGAEVTIVRIPRAGAKVDASAVDDFWVRYLDAQGAGRVDVEPLGDL